MIQVIYGLTEIGGSVSLAIIPGDIDSVGKLLNGVQVKIIDESGNKCGVGENGEVCVKRHFKCLGYYGNKKATEQLFDQDGFILSGDIGYFDEEGYLHFIERKKDVLRYRGFKVSPAEIENYLVQNLNIDAACVVGIDDKKYGDLPAAVVVKNEKSNVTKEKIEQLICGKHIFSLTFALENH